MGNNETLMAIEVLAVCRHSSAHWQFTRWVASLQACRKIEMWPAIHFLSAEDTHEAHVSGW